MMGQRILVIRLIRFLANVEENRRDQAHERHPKAKPRVNRPHFVHPFLPPPKHDCEVSLKDLSAQPIKQALPVVEIAKHIAA